MSFSAFLQRHEKSVSLSLAFTCGIVATASLFYTSSTLRRQAVTKELKESIPDISESHRALQLNSFGGASSITSGSSSERATKKEEERIAKIAARAQRGDYDEELILEQLARNRVFLKDAGLEKLRDAFVVVVGLGGVGSHCVAALARSGVSKIRIIDFDQVTLSSLNRHALATLADVGIPKVHCVRKRLEAICPWVRIEARNELFNSNVAEKLLGSWDYMLQDGEDERKQTPDFVVDAIDNIDSKVGLLQYCAVRNIKVVSSMGAGCKSDPTRICVGDISTSVEDPLSKVTRRRLRLLGVKDGIPVVFSTEKPGEGKAELLPVADQEVEKGNVSDLGVLPDFRVRILPVLGTMPAMFGYTVANHIICSIAGYPMDYRVGEKGREKMYDGIAATLQGMEERLVKSVGTGETVGLRIPINREDVAYLVEEVFRGKSVVSGLSTRLALVRWRKPEGGFKGDMSYADEGQKFIKLKLTDLVLMTKEESQKHEKEVLKGDKSPEAFYSEAVIEKVKRRHADEKSFDKYR